MVLLRVFRIFDEFDVLDEIVVLVTWSSPQDKDFVFGQGVLHRFAVEEDLHGADPGVRGFQVAVVIPYSDTCREGQQRRKKEKN